MPITLESRVRRPQVFNLPHEPFCRHRCVCSPLTVAITAENPRTGDRARKHVVKQVPGSMTWLARERKTGLSNALLEVPDIAAAIARGHLRLVEQTAEPHPDGPAAPVAPGASAPTSGATDAPRPTTALAASAAPTAPTPTPTPTPTPKGPT